MKKFFKSLREAVKRHNTVVSARTRYERRHPKADLRYFIPRGF